MVERRKKHLRDLYFSYELFKEGFNKLVSQIRNSNKRYDSVYAVPRGGLLIGVALSHKLRLPLVDCPRYHTLICDDICGTGKALKNYPYHDKYVLIAKDKGINRIKNLKYAFKIDEDVWTTFFWEAL